MDFRSGNLIWHSTCKGPDCGDVGCYGKSCSEKARECNWGCQLFCKLNIAHLKSFNKPVWLQAVLLMDLLSYATISPAVNQIELHPYLTQEALLAFCKSQGILVTGFSPLGASSYIELNMDAGLRTGALEDPVVLKIAQETGKTAAQVILRWHVQRGTAVIPKSTRIERVVENFSVFDFELSDDQVRTLSFPLHDNI